MKKEELKKLNLKKLKRRELLEIMLAQSREIDKLREENRKLQEKLIDREIKIKNAGSLAEAALSVTEIFQEAQKAVDLYLDNLKNTDQIKKQPENKEEKSEGPVSE